MERESIEFDVVIIGAGPSGLAAAIRLKQLANQHQKDIRVCILEKGAEVGAHILSGAVFEPTALDELIPEWRILDTPIKTQAKEDKFLLLMQKKAWSLPIPKTFQNHGNYIISLGNLCRFLAKEAEKLGVEIFPGFPASEILYQDKKVAGVATKDMGIDKEGQKTARYQPGIEIHAKYTLFAEGCRGSLTKQLIEKFKLADHSCPQTYGIGIKELWEVDNAHHQPGKVIHTVGWPLDHKTYGGSFIYHLDDQKIAMGFIVGLDYQNPYLNPFDELQKFKTHPHIKPYFENGKRIAYGARALVEGGLQSLPKLTVPGGLIIGDAAGFLNVKKIKGSHTAMKSGMVAAETVFSAFLENRIGEALDYKGNLEKTWLWRELHEARNIRPAFHWGGLWLGLVYAAIDNYLFKGKAPWTFKNRSDYTQLKLAKSCRKPVYPTPDGKLTFDKLSSVYFSNTNHNENQPCFLKLKNPKLAIDINLALYHSPEQYYCPANVYEILKHANGQSYLQINAQNCLHCKTCDIKDPTQNITWVPPEGGDGPNYGEM